MAARVLCRQVARFRSLPNWRKGLTQTKCIHVKPEDDIKDQQKKDKASQRQENKPRGGYRRHYKPSSYRHTECNSADSHHQTDNDEEEQSHGPSSWQQGNHYSVSSSSANGLLDLASDEVPEPKVPFVSPSHKEQVSPNVKVHRRAFLKCRPEYAFMTLDLTQRPRCIDWEELSLLLQKCSVLHGTIKPSDVSQSLVKLGKSDPGKIRLLHDDRRFVGLLRCSVDHLHSFSQLELLEVLQSFVWLKIPHSHTVLDAYESALSRRANQMSLHSLLLAADLWCCIGRRVPRLLGQVFELIDTNLEQMGVPEVVHLFYIMGEIRHCPMDVVCLLERLLTSVLYQLHPEEIGVVCLGLFKSQTILTRDVVTKLVDRALCFVTEMSDFALVNVVKCLRFSYLHHRKWLEAMAQEVPRRANRLGVQGLMHIALTCSAVHYHNNSILNAIAERIPSCVPDCRSKDLGKLMWAFGTLGFLPSQSPTFYPSLTEGMRQKKAEFHRYPQHLLTGLLGLAFVSQFPKDLVALALNPEFVNFVWKKPSIDLKKDLFTLDGAIALEVPQWTGPRLSSEFKEEVAETLWGLVQSDMCQRPEVLTAESGLQDLLGGEEFVCKRMILPHTRGIDLEIHLDPNGLPIPVKPPSLEQTLSVVPSNQGCEKVNGELAISDELFETLINAQHLSNSSAPSPGLKLVFPFKLLPDESGSRFDSCPDLTSDNPKPQTSTTKCVSPTNENTIKVAVQVSYRNHFYVQSQQLLGLHAMKRRHLKIAGYKVIELLYNEWTPMLKRSKAERLGFLHCKIFDCLG